MLSLLLAREAARLDPNPETTRRLREVLAGSFVERVLRGHEAGLWSAAFSPSGDLVVTASRDGTARLWDGEGKRIAVFSPTGDCVLTASYDCTARLWDLDGITIAVSSGHITPVNSAVFSPSGDLVATGSDEALVRLWDSEGRDVAVLGGHRNDISSGTFSPSEECLLSASFDDTARIWFIRGASLLARADEVATRDFTREERGIYRDLLGIVEDDRDD